MKKLPDTNLWLPNKDKAALLENLFVKQCNDIELNILDRFKKEKEKSIFTYDSGISLEEILIDEFHSIFPKRYLITNGILSDDRGFTSGHCDIVFFNETWFPYIMNGAVKESRKKYLPINGTYAVGEVKSTLNVDTLDEACKKLVSTSRLSRLKAEKNRIVENRKNSSISSGQVNPLYTFIFSASIDNNFDFQDLVNRFVEINRKLKRSEMIRALCVPMYGTILWGYSNESNVSRPALFMDEDLKKNLYPIFIPHQDGYPSLYSFVCNLQLHLYQSILPAEDFSLHYGSDKFILKAPTENFEAIEPDG